MSEHRVKQAKTETGQPVTLGGKSVLRLHELYILALAANKQAQAAQAAYVEELTRVGDLMAPDVAIERLQIDFLAHTLSVHPEAAPAAPPEAPQ